MTTQVVQRQPRSLLAAGRPAGIYEPLPWLVVRTPLLPIADVDRYAASPKAVLADPAVVRALAVGSPDLLAALERSDASAKDARRAQLKLARYLVRMATRPTPYGAFAAVSMARWGDGPPVRLASAGERLRTRPDMGWLAGVLHRQLALPEVRHERRWVVNPLLVLGGGRYVVPGPDGRPRSVAATPASAAAVDLTCHPVGYRALHAALADRTGGTPAQVDALLATLIDQGLLTSDLEPGLTLPQPAQRCRRLLAEGASTRCVATGWSD